MKMDPIGRLWTQQTASTGSAGTTALPSGTGITNQAPTWLLASVQKIAFGVSAGLVATLASTAPATPRVERPSIVLPADHLQPEQQTRLYCMFRHLEFLASEAGHNLISQETVQHVKDVWRAARAAVGIALTVPSSANGPEEEVLLRWTCNPHTLEVNVFPTGRAEWFYWHQATGEAWENSAEAAGRLPPEVALKLQFIASLKAGSQVVGSAALR